MRFIAKFDFLSVKPKIMFYSEERYKTTIGGLFSILAYLSIIGISSYLSYICIKREEMLIVYNKVNTGFPVKDFFADPVMFVPTDDRGIIIRNIQRYISITPSFRWINKNFKISALDLNMEYDCNSKVTELWPKIKDQPWIQRIFKSKTAMCIDPNHLELKNKTIYGKNDDVKFGEGKGLSFLNVYINKCINDTAKNITNCHPQEKIDKRLSNFYLNIITMDHAIDNYNLTSVKQIKIKNEVIPLSPKLYRTIDIKYKHVDYITDFGYLFESNTVETFSIQEKYTETADIKTDTLIPGNFALIKFFNSLNKDKYIRKFQKLENLFANIGGAVKAILLIFEIIENYISDALYYIKLSNDIISFEGLEDYDYTYNRKRASSLKLNRFASKKNINEGLKLKNNFIEDKINDTKTPMVIKRDGDFVADKNETKPPININENSKKVNNIPNVGDSPIEQNVLEPVISKTRNVNTFSEVKYPKFSFTCLEYLSLYLMQSKKYDVYKVVNRYIDRKTSIDHIIKKLHEVDINRFITLETDHLKWIKMIPGPDIDHLHKNIMTSDLQHLWSENEFNHEISASDKQLIQMSLRNKEEHDDLEKKLLKMTEKRKDNINESENIRA